MPQPLAPSDAIVVLTGAGISRESGLDTFRDAGGLWSRVRVEDVATPEAFARDPQQVQAFYNARRRRLLEGAVQPNPANRALARLQAAWPGPLLLVTQNIDDLHERGGFHAPLHMHGELLKARCTACAAASPWREEILARSTCPACRVSGRLRPHVVWFGELPLEMERIYAALGGCALFVAIGTSGNVYPAAGFVAAAARAGAHTIELNLEPSAGRDQFAERIYGPASRVVPEFVERLLRAVAA